MSWRSVSVQGGSSAALFLGEMKAHLRQDHNDDDGSILAYTQAAVGYVENFCAAVLLTGTVTATCDELPCILKLPRAPLVALTAFETMINGVWTAATLADLRAEQAVVPFITPAWGKSWPQHDAGPGVIRVTYTAGYGAGTNDVPEPIRHALKLFVEQQYDSEKNHTDLIAALLAPYRAYWI